MVMLESIVVYPYIYKVANLQRPEKAKAANLNNATLGFRRYFELMSMQISLYEMDLNFKCS
jgi:hypothetical protein